MASIKSLYTKFDRYIKLMEEGGIEQRFPHLRYGMGILCNYVLFRATITDYFELRLFQKKYHEKQQYMTSKMGLYFAEKVDTKEQLKRLNSKKAMYNQLHKYVGREQLFTDEMSYEDFEAFVEKHPVFIYKPDSLDCGRGVEKWAVTPEHMDEMYRKATHSPAILDELVEQHPLMKRLNESSVNTVRIFTLRIGDVIHYIGASLRMGRGPTVVDNYSAGGLVGALDLNRGVVIDNAEDAAGNRYSIHPISGVPIKGFRIPHWKQVINLARTCALDYELNYVAWDIAVRKNDCVLIEANPNGMINTIQIAGAGGRRRQYSKLLAEFKNNE